MRSRLLLTSSLLLAGLAFIHVNAAPQDPQEPVQQQGGGRGRQGAAGPQGRGLFPQQQRKLADPAVLARGKGLYDSTCSACHGLDLRGGQQGGPNLLRSQTVLFDKDGELIAPIVTGGRPNPPPGSPVMPPFAFPPDDVKAIAEYLHSVLAQAGRQGRPPEGEVVPAEKILVGDVAAGEAYFQANCSSCHSTSGDLKGIASRAADARELQNLWVSGGGGGRGGRGRGSAGRPVTVAVTPSGGTRVEGRLVRIDDFTVSLIQPDGARRTFTRNGADPKVDVSDPADAHRKMVMALSDKSMHDVTAYLWTLK